MDVNYPSTAVMILISSLLERVAFAKELSTEARVKAELFQLYSEVEERLVKLKSIIETNGFSTEYTKLLSTSLNDLTKGFSRGYGPGERKPITLQDAERETFKRQQERDQEEIVKTLAEFISMSNFFISLDFFTRDLVIVGSNGSGKSSLASYFRGHIKSNGIIIAAQRILNIQMFDSFMSEPFINDQLKSIQLTSKDRNVDYDKIQSEFTILIQALLVEDNAISKTYKRDADFQARQKKPIDPPPVTKLYKLQDIWNSTFPHLQISIEDGLNFVARTKKALQFNAREMSDGERVALFLVAHVLLCPKDGFIIVDEPEMYLHPTVYKKLWSTLEKERRDCVFVYLTHNLDFAASRTNAKKLWIRSFTYPFKFEFEEINENEIPQQLLLELLGSRQHILFCEGSSSSLDTKVYNILYQDFSVKAVEGCLSVINYTKAFNRLPFANKNVQAFGLIDGDYLSQVQLHSLKEENIFALEVPDVENLLMMEVILASVYNNLLIKKGSVEEIKFSVLKKLKDQKEMEIAKFVSSKMDHYFKDENVNSSKDIKILKDNYKAFTDKVTIDEWASQRRKKIDKILKENDYVSAIAIFKSKKLYKIADEVFKIKNYQVVALQLLSESDEMQREMKVYIPLKLTESNK